MKKQNEFWIVPFHDKQDFYEDEYQVVISKHPIEKYVHVREVSTEKDQEELKWVKHIARETAIQKMVSCLEAYLEGEHILESEGMTGEVMLEYGFELKIKEALEAWRKANE